MQGTSWTATPGGWAGAGGIASTTLPPIDAAALLTMPGGALLRLTTACGQAVHLPLDAETAREVAVLAAHLAAHLDAEAGRAGAPQAGPG